MAILRLSILALSILSFRVSQAQDFEIIPNVSHSGRILSSAISEDGRYLVTGGEDLFIKLWDLESGKLINSYKKSNLMPVALRFINNDQIVAGFGKLVDDYGDYIPTGNIIQIIIFRFDGSLVKEEYKFYPELLYPQLLDISNDGTQLLISQKTKIAVINSLTGKELKSFKRKKLELTNYGDDEIQARLSPQSDLVVLYAYSSEEKRIINIESGEIVDASFLQLDIWSYFGFSNSGNLFYEMERSSSFDSEPSEIRIYDVSDSFKLRSTIKTFYYEPKINIISDSVYVVSKDLEGTIESEVDLFDLNTGNQMQLDLLYAPYSLFLPINNNQIILDVISNWGGSSPGIKVINPNISYEYNLDNYHFQGVGLIGYPKMPMLFNDDLRIIDFLEGSIFFSRGKYGASSYREYSSYNMLESKFLRVLSTDQKKAAIESEFYDLNYSKIVKEQIDKRALKSPWLNFIYDNDDLVILDSLPDEEKWQKQLVEHQGIIKEYTKELMNRTQEFMNNSQWLLEDQGYQDEFIGKIKYSPNGEWLIISTPSKFLVLDIASKDVMLRFAQSLGEKGYYNDVDIGKLEYDIFFNENGIALLSNSINGELKFFDMDSGKLILRLFVFWGDTGDGIKDEISWVCVNEDGLFDGKAKRINDLAHFSNKFEIIELEQLKERFYEPNLISKVLGFSTEPLRKTKGLGSIDSYPEINLLHPLQNNGNLGVELINRGGGIGKVNIWINGKEVTIDARDADSNSKAQNVKLDYRIEGHPYLKQGEVNEIEVKAYNEQEYLSSPGKKVIYIPKGKKEDYEPTLYAVVIGTSNYRGEALDLRFAAKDAVDFAGALTVVGEQFFSEDRVNMHLLTTESTNAPTKENIANAFKTVSSTAKPSDVLVVYLSGHGVNYGGSDGDFYYLTMHAHTGNIKDPAIRESVGISSAELTEFIKLVPALKQVLILDACHSGQVAEDLMVSRSDRPSSEIRALERMKDRTGTYVLAGSAADAVSYETSIYGQGLLTYSLLFGMKGAALRDNKFVDVVRLFQYAADKVPELAENIGGIQKPEVRMPYGAQSFDLGISNEEIREKIILPTPKPLFVRSSFANEETFNDDIHLSEELDQQLREYSSKKSIEQALIFIDAARFSDAYSLKGRYTKSNDNRFVVEIRLFKGEKQVHSFKIDDIESNLVLRILDKVKEELN